MIVHRQILLIKAGYMEKAIQMLQDARQNIQPKTMRIYKGNIGPQDNTLVFEIEFENLTDLDQFWAEWFALPETGAFLEKWNTLGKPGAVNQVWNLIE